MNLIFYINAQDITLLSATGTVQIKPNEKANWVAAKVGQKLGIGNFIFTGFNSNAVLQTIKAKIEVKPLTQVSIDTLVQDNSNIITDVQLKYGKVTATVDKKEDKTVLFKVRSANSTASVRGTQFTLSDDELYVKEGTVYLVNNKINNSLLVQKNERVYIPNLDIIKDPYKVTVDDYYVAPTPLGLSDTELTNIDRNSFTRNGISQSKAQVIITITIVD
jgi:FecR protein